MIPLDEQIARLGPRGRAALQTLEITDRLVREAKRPGFAADRWDELAALFAVDIYQRVAANREARGWAEDVRLRHQFALVAEFRHDVRRIIEAGNVVFIDVIETVVTEDDTFSVNTLGMLEFDEAGLIVRNTTFQQWDPTRAPGHVGRQG